jgi:CHAD domain-containing protein
VSRSASTISRAADTIVRLGTPGVSSSSPDLRSIVIGSLEERWQVFALLAENVRRRPSKKAVHDLRVAARRLISLLDIVGEVVDEPVVRRLRKQLKKHLRAFSALRDNQVQIGLARSLAAQFPALRLFLTVLMVREKRLLKDARREVTPRRVLALRVHLDRIGVALGMVLDDPELMQILPGVFMGVLARTYARSVVMKSAALGGDVEAIHRLRLSFKHFRYSVEALRRMFPGGSDRLLKALNQYQTRMGAVQDFQLFAAAVTRYVRGKRPLPPDQSVLLQKTLARRRQELIQVFLDSAEELPQFWEALQLRGGRGS